MRWWCWGASRATRSRAARFRSTAPRRSRRCAGSAGASAAAARWPPPRRRAGTDPDRALGRGALLRAIARGAAAGRARRGALAGGPLPSRARAALRVRRSGARRRGGHRRGARRHARRLGRGRHGAGTPPRAEPAPRRSPRAHPRSPRQPLARGHGVGAGSTAGALRDPRPGDRARGGRHAVDRPGLARAPARRRHPDARAGRAVRARPDGVALALDQALFAACAEEMGPPLMRAAHSPNIKERLDYSCAVFDARGRLVAQAAHIPVHLGSLPRAVEAALARGPLAPGDTVLLNDPFAGGTHLPDVTLVSPVVLC